MLSVKKLQTLVLAVPRVLLCAPMLALAFIELKSNFKRNASHIMPYKRVDFISNEDLCGVDTNQLL